MFRLQNILIVGLSTHAFGYIRVFLSVGAHICASVIQLCLVVGHPASLYIDSSSLKLQALFSALTVALFVYRTSLKTAFNKFTLYILKMYFKDLSVNNSTIHKIHKKKKTDLIIFHLNISSNFK